VRPAPTAAATLALVALWAHAAGAGVISARSLPTDCDNSGTVNRLDYALFAAFFDGPVVGSAGKCRCFDVDGSRSVDLRDFAVMQRAFGSSDAGADPAPNNIFVLQLADYHARCAAGDGGDRRCHVGDACCQVTTGDPSEPCALLADEWIRACDQNADGIRDRLGDIDTLGEWNDLFWQPDDSCNLTAREQYPRGDTTKPYIRHFIPMCTDGSTPPKGTTVCPDGQPIIQCTDGTRPLFYYMPGTEDRWIVKVQGGGITCSAASDSPNGDCWEDADRAHYSTAWGAHETTQAFQGMFAGNNADFANYHRVMIDKCVGDRNAGSSTIDNRNFYADDGTWKGQGPVYFHGFRETQAVLAYLAGWDHDAKLTQTSQIALTTQSNGSNGLYMYIDRIAEFIRHDPGDGQPGLGLTEADVRGLASGYVRASVEAENLINNPSQDIFAWSDYDPMHFDDHITAPQSTGTDWPADGLWYSSLVYHDGREFRNFTGWGAVVSSAGIPTSTDDITDVVTLDESCFRAHGLYGGGGAHIEACLDSMHVAMNHLTTPVFFAPQLYDFKIRQIGQHTRITDAFADLGYTPDPGSVCGSHDENFLCVEQAACPEGATACDPAQTADADFDGMDLAVRVRAITRGAVDRSTGTPEETPADANAPVGHAVFAPEWDTHSAWADQEKMNYRICDGDYAAGDCAWRGATLTAAVRSWLELNATVICVERDLPGVDPNRPLTAWSETTPGPVLDDRCGFPGN